MAAETPELSTPETQAPPPARRGVKPSVLVFGLLVVAAGAFGLYEMTRASGKHVVHTGACAQSLDIAQAIDPLAHGEVAALTLATKPNPLGSVAFDDAQGMKTTVASFKGRAILLNLWATWCAPCKAEMPALDKLQAEKGSQGFAVVPVNIDTTRLDKPKAFLKEIGATSLPYYADNTADILQALKQSAKASGEDNAIVGLPTTILIGRDGCEIATMAGPAQWDSPEAKALIDRLKDQAASS